MQPVGRPPCRSEGGNAFKVPRFRLRQNSGGGSSVRGDAHRSQAGVRTCEAREAVSSWHPSLGGALFFSGVAPVSAQEQAIKGGY